MTDSDGASNSTLAHLVVNEEIDYPPKANAGKKARNLSGKVAV